MVQFHQTQETTAYGSVSSDTGDHCIWFSFIKHSRPLRMVQFHQTQETTAYGSMWCCHLLRSIRTLNQTQETTVYGSVSSDTGDHCVWFSFIRHRRPLRMVQFHHTQETTAYGSVSSDTG